ncbi:MAG: DUF2062 domain-containing protein [Pseudomonadota bacterium]
MNPKDILKKHLVSREDIANMRVARWFGTHIHHAPIWHLGRRSVAGGVGLGCFLAFIPIPIQMVLAIPACVLLRVNLPVTMASVWITNPITFAPMFIFAFKVGAWLTGQDGQAAALTFEPSFAGLAAMFGDLWWPLSVGCFVCGLSCAAIGNLSVRWAWRFYLIRRWNKRRQSGTA